MPSNADQSISVVIPCLNDPDALERCLRRLKDAEANIAAELEVVVADASADDVCAALAMEAGAIVARCPTPGRGPQLNAGAAVSTGTVLVFNHADTELTGRHLSAVMETMTTESTVGGAFFRDLSWQYPALAWTAPWVRLYTRHIGVLYGDQSLFVRRRVFDSMGGFADIPIMEDVDFSSRLRKAGAVALVDPPLRTSMRRFRRRGYLRNKLQNVVIVWLWRLRLLTPAQIYRWYYGHNAKATKVKRET